MNERERSLRAAGRAPRWIARGCVSRPHTKAKRNFRTRQLGTFGPASPVRHIDPAEYQKKDSG